VSEERRKKLATIKLAQELQPAVARVSNAVRKLVTATGTHLGSDCYEHAELSRLLLSDIGFETRRIVGFASWRVGPGPDDVVGHTPYLESHLPPGADKGFPYHAWLDYAGLLVIDCTTYLLSHKAQMLDALDGGHTEVVWCPDFLLLSRKEIRTHNELVLARSPGLVHYDAHPELDPIVSSRFTVDPVDLQVARMILRNPNMNVVGPNDM
jgi:hypothetical protein